METEILEQPDVQEEKKEKPVIPTAADIEAMKRMDEREFLK